MCFTKFVEKRDIWRTNTVLRLEQQIADHDIIVYKLLKCKSFFFYKRYYSIIEGFHYKKHKLYGTPLGVNCEYWCSNVSEGVYVYKIIGNQGFHSYVNLYEPFEKSQTAAEFIIPKGAIFYVNYENGTYISNKIIFNKVLKSC